MKKLSTMLAACAVALAPVGMQAAVADYDAPAQLAAARADIANWMKYLPDDVFVAHVSMPGSHDSATAHNVTMASSAQAQERSIDEQLAAGIRAFDFRPGMDVVDGENVLKCYHGIAKTDLTFKEAIAKLTAYLTEHPTEFMAMHLFKANYDNTGDAAKLAIFDGLINEIFNEGEFADFFVDYNPYLKVKDMRGKIVVFRRDKMAYANIHKAGNLGGWPSDSELWVPGTAATATNATDLTLYGRIRVTDVSSPKTQEIFDNEINSIKNLFAYNCSETRPNAAAAASGGVYEPEWTMMFTSGEYKVDKKSGQAAYLQNATFTNPLLTGLINEAEVSGPTGIVFSDWVMVDSRTYNDVTYETKGTALVTAIIENNFKYITDFILDDDLFKDPEVTETDRFGGKECFLRNVATGEFLSAGADWGTHAVLHSDGIRITPLFNSRTGEYLLKTTFVQNGVPNYLGDNCYIDNTAPNPVRFIEAGTPGVYYIVRNGVVTEEDGSTRAAVMALTPELTGNTYADGATMLVENRELTEGNPMQQWELFTEEELVKALAASASVDNPADLSFMIRGGKVRVNDSEHTNAWTFLTEEGSTRAKMETGGTNEWWDKVTVYRAYVGYHSKANVSKMHWTLSQEINGLPEGIYSISLQALADNLPLDNEELFSFKANDTDMREGMATASTGKLTCAKALELFRSEEQNNCLLTRDNIEITDGKLNIVARKGVMESNDYNGFFFNNFELKYYGPKNGHDGVDAATDTPAADAPADVFTTAGVMVRQGVPFATATEGLDHGIYIVRTAGAAVKVAR